MLTVTGTNRAFVITSSREVSRIENIRKLQAQVPGLRLVEAIYPKYQKVPFLTKLIQKSKERGGKALNPGEIGIILSNRMIWQEVVRIAASDDEHFLLMESDSCINDVETLHKYAASLTADYDLFFFGAWLGHMQLTRSSRKRVAGIYNVGEPFIQTVCSGYGYSVNRKAARYLLQCTGKIAYPVDEFKKYMAPGVLRIGGIVPELISHQTGESTIGHGGMLPLLERIWLFLLDVRNGIICYFK
ncbi:MAG: hypothetical protein JWQ09_2923 [Segetibacter sp.]|nr:hypothetical protein [Segetibacter sp.]